MSRRNIAWLVVIIAVGVTAGVAWGIWIGIVAAPATLVVSELVERTVRKRRRAAAGVTDAPSLRNAIASRRRTR